MVLKMAMRPISIVAAHFVMLAFKICDALWMATASVQIVIMGCVADLGSLIGAGQQPWEVNRSFLRSLRSSNARLRMLNVLHLNIFYVLFRLRARKAQSHRIQSQKDPKLKIGR